MSFLMSPISAVTTGPPCRPALNSGTMPYRARYRSFCSWITSLMRNTQRRQLPCRSPRSTGLVTDVLVDLSPCLQHGLGEVVEEVVLEVVEAQGSECLGDGRGAVEVQEHEDALLGDGPVVSAQHQAEQRPRAEHAIELSDEVDQKTHERQDHQGHSEPAAE